MAKYVKSYSNYVLKTKHQETNDGIIYERDITTIGGRDHFAAGQVPIYKSGNFLITVNNDNTVYKKTPSDNWKGNDISGDTWTLDILKEYENDEKSSYDKKIVIKKDYYDLRDFAYYGSCSELIRASINNIIKTYPGELFAPVINTWVFDDGYIAYNEDVAKAHSSTIPTPTPNTISVTWTSFSEKDYPEGDDYTSLPNSKNFVLPFDSNSTLFVLDNPFGIDIHSDVVLDKNCQLKYFADEGYKNYVVYIQNEDGEWDLDTSGHSFSWSALTKYDNDKVDFCPGDYMGYVEIKVSKTYRIYVFMGDNNEIKYFFNEKPDIRIRPKNDIINEFYDGLSLFENILLNRDTKFKATFEIIKENEYGYYVDTQIFTFPTTYGGYNLGSKSSIFGEYVSSLAKIGEYYDENFSDNLWKSMTHEAIKNFDWTYSRQFEPGDENEYIEGGNKIQKIIRLYGREFDEIKGYIDNIKQNNNVTYDNINNLPDYFFSDKLEDDGWDVKLVNPLKLTEYIYNENNERVDVTSSTTSSAETTNKYNGKKLERIFSENYINVKPYTKNNITSIKRTSCSGFNNSIDFEIVGYDNTCYSALTLTAEEGESQVEGYHDSCCNLIKIYSSENEYSISDVNSEFLKRFILNSKYILRHKGTIEGIEMLLSLFGMKSKNYVFTNDTYFQVNSGETESSIELTDAGKTYYRKTDLTTSEAYDFDIKEYTLFTNRIEDEWVEKNNMYDMDWVNSKKLTINNGYTPYQGLPVIYRYENPDEEEGENNKRYVYPSFQNYLSYDGGLYYQMKGGWLSKYPFKFDSNDNIIPVDYQTDSERDAILFTETIKNTKCVQTLEELFSNKSLAENTGDICQVLEVSHEMKDRYAIIDGFVYRLYKDEDFTEENDGYYFNVTVENNSLTVGESFFTDYVTISNPYGESGLTKINLNDNTYNGKNIRIYVVNGNVDVHSNINTISTFTLFKDGKYMEGDAEEYSNYFRLNNPDFSNELSVVGWQQLRKNEYEYFIMNSITDNNNGNNPHTGHMNYDNGHEYLLRFRRLFKPTYDNNLFDLNSINDGDIDIYSKSYEYGFNNLVSDDDCNTDYGYLLQEDDKCHYFGDSFTSRGTETKYSLDDGSYMTETTIRKTELGLGTLNQMHYGDELDEDSKKEIDGVTNQIVNTKRVDIDFYLNSPIEYSKEWIEEVKYIDSVILPYLEQMLPSSIIVSINYKNKHSKS